MIRSNTRNRIKILLDMLIVAVPDDAITSPRQNTGMIIA